MEQTSSNCRLSKEAQLNIKWRPPGSLIPYAKNSRKHPRSQIELIGKSIKRFGWTNPILIGPDQQVICGHARLEAALQIGEALVPTIMLDHLSEADRRAYLISDNAIAERSGFDKGILRSELRGLLEIGYDLELTGVDSLTIDTLLSFDEEDSTKEDDVELPLIDAVVSRIGDLWVIGEHKLLVGDARDTAAYERLLDGDLAQMIITDPPYGCPIAGNVSGGGRVKHENFIAGAGEISLTEFGQTLIRPAFKAMARHCQSGALAFVFSDWRAAPYMLDAASGVFDEVKQLIVWAKTNAGQGAFYRSAHELIYAFKVSPGEHINNFGLGQNGRYRTNVWTYPGANVFRKGRMRDLQDHPTIKNKKMIADALLDCSKPGGVILDSFLGSGTALCAAARTGRRGRGIELDPKYADIALRRTAEETGETPTLDGLPLPDVASARKLEGGRNAA